MVVAAPSCPATHALQAAGQAFSDAEGYLNWPFVRFWSRESTLGRPPDSRSRCSAGGRFDRIRVSSQVNGQFSRQGPVTMWCREFLREPLRVARTWFDAAPERCGGPSDPPRRGPLERPVDPRKPRAAVSLFGRSLYTLGAASCVFVHPHRRSGDVKVVSPGERHCRWRLARALSICGPTSRRGGGV